LWYSGWWRRWPGRCPPGPRHQAIGTDIAAHGRPITVTRFTIAGDRIVAIDLIGNADRIADDGLTILNC
jgi:hypothetical protein